VQDSLAHPGSRGIYKILRDISLAVSGEVLFSETDLPKKETTAMIERNLSLTLPTQILAIIPSLLNLEGQSDPEAYLPS